MASNLVVAAPGIRLIRRVERGDDGDDVTGVGSAETAAMASSSVTCKLSFSTAESWVAKNIEQDGKGRSKLECKTVSYKTNAPTLSYGRHD